MTPTAAATTPLTGSQPVRPLFDQELAPDAFSRVIHGMVGSEVLRIAAEVRQLMADGRPVCNLTVGDFNPDQFPVPGELAQALVAAIQGGQTNYPPSDGVLDLRRAILEFVAREQSVEFPLESVLVAAGVRPLLY